MNRVLWLLLAIGSLAAVMVCIIMTVMAVKYMEWGRVLFYGFIAILSLETMALAFLNFKKKS